MKNEISPLITIEEISANKARKKLGDFAYGLIFAKSAGRCQFCNKLLYEHHLTTESCNLSELAHIVAFKEAGPRGDKEKSLIFDGKECNFLLLCHDCHRLIDHEGKYTYTEEQLLRMKQTKEEAVRKVTEVVVSTKTNTIIYTSRIGDFMPTISTQEVREAVIADNMYPASNEPINLSGTDLGIGDTENLFWDVEAKRLENLFKKSVFNGNESTRNSQNYSVFALAPQPLLVKLGTLLESKTTTYVFQRHREPVESWCWPRIESRDEIVLTPPVPDAMGIPVLILAISASAIVTCVEEQLHSSTENVWKIEAKTPGYNWCANKYEQQIFKEATRKTLDSIRTKCPGEAIQVFMSMPNSLAVEFGRLWMPKADAPLELYDIDKNTKIYNKVLKIDN